MLILNPPKHPTNPEAQCDACRFWLQPGAKMVLVPTPGGQVQAVPFPHAMQQGMINETTKTVYVSQCTLSPTWQPAPENHWCHQFMPMDKI